MCVFVYNWYSCFIYMLPNYIRLSGLILTPLPLLYIIARYCYSSVHIYVLYICSFRHSGFYDSAILFLYVWKSLSSYLPLTVYPSVLCCPWHIILTVLAISNCLFSCMVFFQFNCSLCSSHTVLGKLFFLAFTSYFWSTCSWSLTSSIFSPGPTAESCLPGGTACWGPQCDASGCCWGRRHVRNSGDTRKRYHMICNKIMLIR